MNIGHIRLFNQLISDTRFTRPDEVVSWMGAMQAQDYAGAKWAIGLRLPHASDHDIEKAISSRLIIRSWPMRGTLHFVAAKDIRWMLSLLAPRIINGSTHRHNQLELNEKIFAKARELLEKNLQGGKQLTRQEIFQLFESAKIATKNQRGIHIIQKHALDGLICFGVHEGKQSTFVLMDEWIPKTNKLERDEALASLAIRYFTSHGPATIKDFIWWTGLTAPMGREAIELAKPGIISEKINETPYWFNPETIHSYSTSPSAFLLPGFDEFILGYTDRSDVIEEKFKKKLSPGGGMFNPTIVLEGKIAGTWKRNIKKNKVDLTILPFKKLTSTQYNLIFSCKESYLKYLNY